MPVVIVTARTLPAGAAQAALGALNGAVAAALGLPTDGVHSMLVPAIAACTGTSADAPWPTAVLHGRAREPRALALALDAAIAVLAQHWSCPPDNVWVQWAIKP